LNPTPGRRPCRRGGFTLVELLVALAIAAVLLAVSVPSAGRFYTSMQYRSAVRDVVSVLNGARYAAVNSGRSQDVTINPTTNAVNSAAGARQLPEGLSLTVHAARELNRSDAGVIRFYPQGGSSGGGVDIDSPNGGGVRITVDWLRGSVSQRRYGEDGPGDAWPDADADA
jgi:general secretion pathway protein H